MLHPGDAAPAHAAPAYAEPHRLTFPPCRLLPPPPHSWLENFAAAADAVGIPVCMTVAVVDMTTDEAVETRDFHATGPAPGASGKSSKAGKSGKGGN